jgi:hypothetical protein
MRSAYFPMSFVKHCGQTGTFSTRASVKLIK